MAGRVNKQFVVTLALGLGAVFLLVAGAAVFLLKNSAKDLAKAGDSKMAAKQYDKAEEFYAKAVNKEQTNANYLNSWRESLRNLAPESLVTYREYVDQWRRATRQLARVQQTNVASQREYLELVRGTISPYEFNRADHEGMISEADALLAMHKDSPPGGPWETIKRYRGAAKFEIVNFVRDAKPETAKEAETDLLAALAADPADGESAIALESLYLVLANRAAEKSLIDEAAAYEAKATALINDFLQASPDVALVRLGKIRRDLFKTQREAARNRAATPVNVVELIRKLQADLRPDLEASIASIRAMDPAKIDQRIIESMRGTEMYLDPTGKLPYSEETINLALANRPTEATLLASKADLLANRDDLAAASAALKQILDLKMPPTSVEGLRLFALRTNARYLQALWAGRLAAEAPQAERAGAIATAKSLRESLAAVEAADSPPVQFVDAQIAYAEQDFGRANQLLDRYNKATKARPNADALFLAAQTAERINQPGLAKIMLEECLKAAPTKLPALYALAEMETRLQNFDRALQLYTSLQQLSPDNKAIKERIELLASLAGGATKVNDPVMQTLIEVRNMSSNKAGEKDRSTEIIPLLKRKVEEFKYDPRIVRALCQALAREDNRAEAIAIVKQALTLHPQDRDLKDLQINLANTDPLQAQLALIDSKEALPIEKALARYYVYRTAGKAEESKTQMALAVGIDASDKRVVEYLFLDAMEAKDWPEAQRLTDIAVKDNMDDTEGLTFKARLLASQNKLTEALAAINEAVAKGGALPEVWRLKGRMESVAGLGSAAVLSFQQALSLRPTDVGTINDLLASLNAIGRSEEALALARESEKYAGGDPTFTAAWLALESSVGNKIFATDKREAIAKTAPNDRANLISLAALYISEREWAKARPVIDRARAIGDGLDILSLDASWNWEQGQREVARKLFADFIAATPQDKLNSYPSMIQAQFYAQRNDTQSALIVLEEARKLQDPKNAEVDKAIVEVLMKEMRYEDAAAVCRRIVNAGADTDGFLYQKRLVESLVKLKNYKDADTELVELQKRKEPDAITTLLIADVKGGLNDIRGQKDILDLAVARFPTDAMVFLKRGQSLMGDSKSARDAISDFNRAIQLNPNLWQAHRMRGAANITINEVDEAIKDLRSAVKLAPYNNELLFGLLADLLRMGRVNDAMDIATEVAAKRNRDVEAIATIGTVFASAGSQVEASRFFKMAFDLDKQDLIVQRYLDSLLNSVPPNTAEAQQVLISVGEQRIKGNPGFLMALAKLSMKLNRKEDANAAASDALRLLKNTEPTMMLAWFNDLRKLLPKKDELVRYLEATAKLASAQQSQDWLNYFRVSANLEDPSTRSATIGQGRDLLAKAEDASIRQLLFRSISSAIYSDQDYPAAIRLMREGLGEFPNDVELLNNAAYGLAVHLNQAEDAIPLIEKAVSLTPAVADIQDSYGMVYLLAKQCDKAVDGFRKALLLSSTPQQTVNYANHLIDALLCSGRKDEARLLLKDTQRTVDANSSALSEKSLAEFEVVKKKMETQ